MREGDFAYNPMRLNVGSIGLAGAAVNGIVSSDYIVFRCREGALDAHFFDFFRRTDSWRNQIAQSGQGSVRIRYYFRHIAEFLVPLPEIDEQRAIADVLMTVQRAKEATEKVLAATRELKRSLMRHLFTYGPVPVQDIPKVKLKETDIGPIPEHWEVKTVRELCSKISSGGTPSTLKPEYWGGPVPWVSAKDMKQEVLTGSHKTVTERAIGHGTRLADSDTVFVVVRGLILAKTIPVAVAAKPMAFNQDLLGCAPKPGVSGSFLYLAMESRKASLRSRVSYAGHGTARLDTSAIRELQVAVPTTDERSQLVDCWRRVSGREQLLLGKAQALDGLFLTLMSELMSGTKRVPLEEN